jgi:hypothetical protein
MSTLWRRRLAQPKQPRPAPQTDHLFGLGGFNFHGISFLRRWIKQKNRPEAPGRAYWDYTFEPLEQRAPANLGKL